MKVTLRGASKPLTKDLRLTARLALRPDEGDEGAQSLRQAVGLTQGIPSPVRGYSMKETVGILSGSIALWCERLR